MKITITCRPRAHHALKFGDSGEPRAAADIESKSPASEAQGF
jgi:hypothetical protein